MNISAGRAITIGVRRSIRNWRLAILIYVLNFFLALLIAAPMSRLLAGNMPNNHGSVGALTEIDYRWLVEFIHSSARYLDLLVPQTAAIAVAYLLFEIFLAGGLFAVLASDDISKVRRLLTQSSSKFFSMLVVSLLETALLCSVLLAGSFFSPPPSPVGLAASLAALFDRGIAKDALAVLFVFVVVLLSDFARAAIVIDEGKFREKFSRGIGFAFSNPLSVCGVFLGCLLLETAVVASMILIGLHLTASGLAGIAVQLVALQGLVLLRILTKLIFYASESALYKETRIEVITVKPEMLE